MSTNKHIDKICIAAVCVMLLLTGLFMNAGSFGISASANTMKYESTLFDTSYVHTIDIVADNWDSFIEGCENEEYTCCTVVIDGKQYKNTAIRAKGNTSLSSVSSLGSQRYSFKLEFDHYVDGRSCDGLDKLCLNNLIQDTTMMKDYIAYTLMNDFGVDSPLCSFAYITVNGEDWGLYLAVEGVEDSFLKRNYGSDAGDLYKPDSLSFGGGRGNGKDFDMNSFDFGSSDSENSESSDSESSDSEGSDSSETQLPDNSGTQSLPSGDGSFSMPEGFTPGGQMPSDGSFSMPEGFSFTPGGQMPSNGSFSMPDGDMPQMPGSDGQSFDFSQIAGIFSGMGSDDVKLKYIDDDPDSYANIFDSAKTEVSPADQKRLISSLKNLSEYTDLENTLDTDEVLRYFVVHNFLVNGDSYTGAMIHNYYLHESDGKLSMIPWDYNLAFGTFMGGSASSSVNDSIDEVLSDRPMQAWIFSDENYTEAYHALYSEFIEKWFTNGELEKLISDTAQMLRPYVEKDPSKFCTTEEFETGVETLQQFVSFRAEAVSRQLDGDTTAVETGNLNLSDIGSMGGSMGFGGMGTGSRDSSTDSSNRNTGNTNETDFSMGSFSMPQFDGSMPQTGDGSMPQTGEGNMPQFGDGTMPQFGDGNMPQTGDGSMPQTGDGNMPQIGEGSSVNTAEESSIAAAETQTQEEEASAGSEEEAAAGSFDFSKFNPADSNSGSFPPGNSFSPGSGFSFDGSSGASDLFKWGLVGISILVLAAGLLIAVKKKY